MEKIKKFLLKLSKQERNKLELIIKHVIENELNDFDVKKLKGHDDVFRVRVGKMRVIFRNSDKENLILEVSRRSDSTYKKL